MNKITTCLALLALIAGASNAVAQSATVGSGSGGPNDVVVIPVNFATGALGLGAFDLDISFDGTKFSAASANCAVTALGQNTSNCSGNAGSNKLRISVVANPGIPLTAGLAANLSFTLAPGVTPGNIPLDGAFFSITTIDFDEPEPSGFSVTDGNISVDGPEYSSNPAAGGGIEFVFGPVIQNAALASQNLIITNTGVGILEGTCTETSDPSNVFTVTNGAYEAGAGLSDTVTVACNSAGPIATHTGQMSCTHNGGNVASPVVYDLSCQITAGPQPQFSASPNSLVFNAFEQGASIPSQNFTISNAGDSGTTLSSTGAGCSISGADAAQFSIAGGGTFSVPFGGTAVKAVSCDTSTEGSYSAQIDCTHNGGNNPSNNAVSLSCEVGPPGAAIYESTPAPGFAFEFADAIAPTDPPTLNLNIRNAAEVGNNELFVNCQFDGSSSPEITYTPTYAGVPFASGGGNANITLACDAESIGNYSATLVCDYGVDGSSTTGGPGSGTASYTVSCDVRGPATEVVPTVPDGTTQIVSVTIGGTGSFSVGFAENFGDNPAPDPYDAFIQGCEISGTDAGIFSITSPNSFPVEIPTDSTVNVTVEGTDDQSKESYSAALDCVYADTSDSCRIPVVMDATTGIDVCGRSVSYPIVMNVGGGDARFTVLKEFTDGNPGEVTVDLDCDSGLLLDQEKTITEDGIGVTFVVTDFDSGELNCNVTERAVAGYSTDYDSADSDSASTDSGDSVDGCFYTLIDGGDENSCVITNSPDDVDVVITKEWLYPGSADSTSVSDDFTFVLYCSDASIVGGSKIGGYYEELTDSPSAYLDSCAYSYGDKPKSASYDEYCKTLYGSGNKTFKEKVNPYVWPGGSCYVEEVDVDPSVEVDNGCGSLEVSVGSGDSCTITNTVFFEGIPTLSQYGMALMALLMLGMGFVAVRRIV